MEIKVCDVCGEEKPIEKFNKTGQRYRMKTCRSCNHKQKKSDPKYMMSRMLTQARRRCENPKCHGYERYGGRGITYSITNDEFYTKFYRVVEKLIARGDTPSIDRIDPNGHYTIDNVQVVPWEANKAEARQRMSKQFKKYRQRPIRICRICQRSLDIDNFITGKVHDDGTVTKYTECRECWNKICHEKGYGERTKKPGTLETWKNLIKGD